MKDTRDCPNCIFHDLTCRRWDCKEITRIEAEHAVDTLRDLAERYDLHNMVCVGDILRQMVRGDRS